MVSPKEFAKAVLPHGTTTVITDPHEIANVMGTDGIEYMLQATEDLPVDVRFMLPSCVPATPMDESGAVLDYRAIDSFYSHPRVLGLAEVMNYVGTVAGDSQVLEKIAAAQSYHKKIDGHAPGITGYDLNAYVAAGVYSDHECSDPSDALRKLELGQYIMIREGTAARNLTVERCVLTPQYADRCMFCCDDKHPSDLLEKGHIDYLVKASIQAGVDPILAVKAACFNAARYFLLNNRGAIAPGYLADFVVIDNFSDFHIQKVFKRGELMFSGGVLKDFPAAQVDPNLVRRAHDTFHVAPPLRQGLPGSPLPGPDRPGGWGNSHRGPGLRGQNRPGPGYFEDSRHRAAQEHPAHRHRLSPGVRPPGGGGGHQHLPTTPTISLWWGPTRPPWPRPPTAWWRAAGGIVVWKDGRCAGQVALPIAGIMSEDPLEQVNQDLEHAKSVAFSLGVSSGIDPFMTLSFLALPVIPTLRLTTRGVIDVNTQQYI